MMTESLSWIQMNLIAKKRLLCLAKSHPENMITTTNGYFRLELGYLEENGLY